MVAFLANKTCLKVLCQTIASDIACRSECFVTGMHIAFINRNGGFSGK
jgi:hypothetical protein